MMGWRIRLIRGDEWDAVSRRARRIMNFRAGEKSAARKAIHKRARRLVKRELVSQDQP
jgi:hypothetical protein